MTRHQSYYLLAFANTHAAMTAEGILKEQHEITIIPTLREISAGCGISIKIEAAEIEAAQKTLKKAKFDETMMSVYFICDVDGKICPKRMDLNRD